MTREILPKISSRLKSLKASNTGRVKTLHPGVHGGILAKRDDASHMDALHKHELSLIDVVGLKSPLTCLSSAIDNTA